MKMSDSSQGTFDDFDEHLKIVNDLQWNLTFYSQNDNWQLLSNGKLLATFENELEMKSFIAGMALAIGVLPPEIIDQIKKFIN